jgi:hypothetical protein
MPSFNMQTAYTNAYPRGVMGQIANEEKYNAVSRTVQTTAGLAFGAPAGRGTLDHTCILYAAGGKFMGIAVKTVAPEHRATGAAAITDGYPVNTTAGLMTEGQMYVLVNTAVAAGDAVYWNAASGRYTNVNTDVAIPNARFDTTATAAGQIVEISLGNHRVA